MIIIFLWYAFLLGFHIHVHKIFWHTYICLGINSTLIFNIWLDITYALQCTDYSKFESLSHIVYHIYKFTCWWINMNIHVTVSGLLYFFIETTIIGLVFRPFSEKVHEVMFKIILENKEQWKYEIHIISKTDLQGQFEQR